MIGDIPFCKDEKIIEQHHERIDVSVIPKELKETKWTLAKIIGVADAVDAMMNKTALSFCRTPFMFE